MAKNEQRIANVQQSLDEMANRIDLAEFDGSIDEDELNRKYVNCLKILHARHSAVLHILKTKDFEPKPVKPLEDE